MRTPTATAVYFVTCPECKGARVLPGRVVCWKCEGEGRLSIPDRPVFYFNPRLARRITIAVWVVAVILGAVAVIVSFSGGGQ